MAVKYFLDTYALIEIAKGNKKFEKYLEKEVYATELTLAEFYGVILRRFNQQTANHWSKKFLSLRKSTSYDTMLEAIRFRHEHKGISFFDAQGYCKAQASNAKFLTGDEEFKGVDGVEFVKA